MGLFWIQGYRTAQTAHCALLCLKKHGRKSSSSGGKFEEMLMKISEIFRGAVFPQSQEGFSAASPQIQT